MSDEENHKNTEKKYKILKFSKLKRKKNNLSNKFMDAIINEEKSEKDIKKMESEQPLFEKTSPEKPDKKKSVENKFAPLPNLPISKRYFGLKPAFNFESDEEKPFIGLKEINEETNNYDLWNETIDTDQKPKIIKRKAYVDEKGYYCSYMGDTLSQLFEVIGFLGKGEFSVVYKVKSIESQKVFALKIMRKNDEITDCGKREVQMLKELNTENKNVFLVKFTDHFWHLGLLCILIDFWQFDLRNYLQKKGGVLKLQEVRKIGEQLMSSLIFLAEKEVAHLDSEFKSQARQYYGQ